MQDAAKPTGVAVVPQCLEHRSCPAWSCNHDVGIRFCILGICRYNTWYIIKCEFCEVGIWTEPVECVWTWRCLSPQMLRSLPSSLFTHSTTIKHWHASLYRLHLLCLQISAVWIASVLYVSLWNFKFYTGYSFCSSSSIYKFIFVNYLPPLPSALFCSIVPQHDRESGPMTGQLSNQTVNGVIDAVIKTRLVDHRP